MGDGTADQPEHDGQRPVGSVDGKEDVLLDVPEIKVEAIELEVSNLQAGVSLQAEVPNLLRLNIGVHANLGQVRLNVKGVEARALLKVRLDQIAGILNNVFGTVQAHPEIVERLAKNTGELLREAGTAAGQTLPEVGWMAGETLTETGPAAAQEVQRVGQAAGEAGQQVARDAGQAAQRAGQAAGQAGQAAEQARQGASDAAQQTRTAQQAAQGSDQSRQNAERARQEADPATDRTGPDENYPS
jgi:methyl-accepting chemotaxis protein